MDESSQNQNGQLGPHGGPMGVGQKQNHEEHNQRTQYSMPGILHFIQHEWARFEMEKAQWEVERAELQARIAFLQGERKGQENLKNDLIRRIKMLEYALRQERIKFHKLKYGEDLNTDGGRIEGEPGDGIESPSSADGDLLLTTSTATSPPTVSWKQGRQLLRQYLQEIGYTDTIIDVRSARVRSLFGLSPVDGVDNDVSGKGGKSAPTVNGGDTSISGNNKRNLESQQKRGGKKVKGGGSLAENILLDAEAVIGDLHFLSGDGVEVDEEDDDEDEECLSDEERDESDTAHDRKKSSKMNEHDDMDAETEEVLNEFDFLLADGSDSADDAEDEVQDEVSEWSGKNVLLAKLKQEYQQDRQLRRKGAQSMDRPKRSKLEAMLASLKDDLMQEEADANQQPGEASSTSEDPKGLTRGKGGMPTSFLNLRGAGAGPGLGRDNLGGKDEDMEEGLGLGELAQLTVNNEADVGYDITSAKEAFRKTWTAKYTLRSHFDVVRALAFLPVEPALITASEDHTLKLWNLQKTVPTKKSASLDVEPVYTFRGHTAPVLCLCVDHSGETCYSGSADNKINCWSIPSSNIDPYDTFDPSVLMYSLNGHTDAVWSLALHPSKGQLLSCSADRTVKLWQPSTPSQPLLATFNTSEQDGMPTCVDFIRAETSPVQMVVGFRSGVSVVFDVETNKPVMRLETPPTGDGAGDGSAAGSAIHAIAAHPTLPLVLTGHEDTHIRFWDVSNTSGPGRLIHSMVAHLDTVTSLAVDPNGLYLVSGSHDCSIRLWNLDDKTCVQEITSHRKKFDESILSVAFHRSKPYIASAGADGVAKVFV